MTNSSVLSIVAQGQSSENIWSKPEFVLAMPDERGYSDPISGISQLIFDPLDVIGSSGGAIMSRYGNGNFSGVSYQGGGKWAEEIAWIPYPKSKPKNFDDKDGGYPAITRA